jgi:hypothetical protein
MTRNDAPTPEQGTRSDDGMAAAVSRLRSEVRILKCYAAGLTAVLGLLVVCGANWANQRQKFDVIDVERINVVEADGRLALVIANGPRLPSPIIGGKERKTGRTGPGMLFFNGKGDECGGLVYTSREKDGSYAAGAHLAFDQYRNDQVVYLSYQDDGKTRSSGFYVHDRPTHPDIEELLQKKEALDRATGEEKERLQRQMRESVARGEFGAQRVFVGSVDQTAMVRLRDTAGRNRVRIYVDAANSARMEFLDEGGKVVYSIPPK